VDVYVARGIARLLGPARLMRAAKGDPELDAATAEVMAMADREHQAESGPGWVTDEATGKTIELSPAVEGEPGMTVTWDEQGIARFEIPPGTSTS
jgi:hypothetical protein